MIDLSTMQYDGVRLITPVATYHSFKDLMLMQTSDFEISEAIPKRHLIEEVWGIDSKLDYTESFGPVRFDNRTITLNFDILDRSLSEWWEVGGCIYNALHGRNIQLIFDSDKDWYWTGFCEVNWAREENIISHVQLIIDAFPYKKTVTKYLKRLTVAAGRTSVVSISNDRMPSVPTITTTLDADVTYDTNSYHLLSGENKADFELLEGITELKFVGGGTIIIEWEGGRLM